MFRAPVPLSKSTAMLTLGLTLVGCGKITPNKPVETARTRAEAKRHKDVCASNAAYGRMKHVLFSQAGGQVGSHPSNLATLEEFSFVRMEDPVVVGWDPALDLTRCRGRFILDVPPGSEQALGGQRRLQADITYTAQGAADASGLVYEIHGAEPIIGKLAAFNLAGATYQPLPAVDSRPARVEAAALGSRGSTADTVTAAPKAPDRTGAEPAATRQIPPQSVSPAVPRTRPAVAALERPSSTASAPTSSAGAEETVRAFYNALGQGNGELASAQVIPAKRSSRAYSPDAISRFYGRLPEPLRLTGVSAVSPDTYRVTYRYAATGSRCNGSAVVRVTHAQGRPLISSIAAGSRC